MTNPKILIKKRIFFNRKGGSMINIDADAIFSVKSFIIYLIAINIIIYVIMEIAGDTQNTQYMLAHGALNVKLILNDGEYYRLFTSMFMHAGFSHIFNNMLVLFFIGDNLERAVGHIRYFIMYIADESFYLNLLDSF